MCYGIRALPAEPGRESSSQPASGFDRLRPRLAGAAAAVLVAGFATAALLTPSPRPAAAVEKVPAVPVTPGIEQTSLGVDDGVPTAMNEVKRGSGECHHGL
jgi:hypothetical protein